MNATRIRTSIVGRLLAVMAGACAVTLIGLFPIPTEADDVTGAATEALQVAANTSRVGAIEATVRAVADDQDPKKWSLEVRYVNRNADQPETADFTEQLQRVAIADEASRVPNMPRAVWSAKEHIELGPGESKTVRHALPDSVGAQLLAYTTARQRAESARARAKGKARANAKAAPANVDPSALGEDGPAMRLANTYYRPMVFGTVVKAKSQAKDQQGPQPQEAARPLVQAKSPRPVVNVQRQSVPSNKLTAL